MILNKLMEAPITNLYHATYTNSVIALTAAGAYNAPLATTEIDRPSIGLATELSSLLVNIAELSALVSPILCMVSSFGPIPLLVLMFVSPRTAHSTLGPKRMCALFMQLGLSQLLGCTSSALKVAKPTTWVLFSIRMVVILRTALSMVTFHGRHTVAFYYYLDLLFVVLIKLKVGRPSSDTSFKLRPPPRPIHSTGYENHDLAHGALPLQRPRTHLSGSSQTSFPKSGIEVGWKWPGSPQRLLVLEPVRTSSISTVGEGARFNLITKKPEMDPFSSTRPNSFDDETVLHVDPQSSSQQCIDPDHERTVQPESQEATPRASVANDIVF